MITKTIRAREARILNFPTHHGAVHRPPNKAKVSSVKMRTKQDINEDMPKSKRVRLNLQTYKNNCYTRPRGEPRRVASSSIMCISSQPADRLDWKFLGGQI